MDKGLSVHPFIVVPVSAPCPCQSLSDGQVGCIAKAPPRGGLGERGHWEQRTERLQSCGWGVVPGCSAARAKNKFG